MSYTTAVDEIKAALEAISGLTYTKEPRLSTLLNEGRAGFNGHFSIDDETGPQPWPELSNNPSEWLSEPVIEIGFEVRTDKLEQTKTLEGWARAATETLRYGSLAYSQIYAWQKPEILKAADGKRRVWVARFKMRYTE